MDLVTLGIALLAVLLYIIYVKSLKPRNFPPGPAGWPWIRNLNVVLMNKGKIHLEFHEMHLKFGGIFGYQMLFYPVVFLSDYQLLKEAFVNQSDIYSDRCMWLPLTKLILRKKGLIGQHGEQWKMMRKLTIKSMRELGLGTGTMEDKVLAETQALTTELKKHNDKELDIHPFLVAATANVVWNVLFGDRNLYDDSDFRQLLESIEFLFKDDAMKSPFSYMPWYYFLLSPILNPTSLKKIPCGRILQRIVKQKIDEHRKQFDPDRVKDMVDLFIQAQTDDDNLQQCVVDMLFAGTDTTAVTLHWMILFMITHPDVQETCRQEIYEAIGPSARPRMCDRDRVPFTCATIMEVQRISNIACVTIPHTNNTPTSLGGFTLPKHTIIFANLYSIHMDPKNWPEPQNLDPKRFLDSDGHCVKTADNFIPFGIGKRSCVGENLAKMELFLVFTTLVQTFRFRPVDGVKLPGLDDATLGLSCHPGEFKVILEEINNN